jgi:glycosyltransferase involved in cell wall biosynthesis
MWHRCGRPERRIVPKIVLCQPCYDPDVRIGIDARKLHDFGIGTYIRNLLKQLARIDRETEFVLLCRAEDRAALEALGPNFRTVVERAGHYSMAEQVTIPLALRRERVTLFHAPHYVLPPLVGCRSVVTIHDCIHLMFPQYLPNPLAYRYARTSIRLAARRATRILTVSESSKRDILRFVDIQADKIDVIYNAYDERFGVEPDPGDVARVRERYQLSGPFVLYAGTVKPHKNLERLIEAFHLVRRQGLDDLTLVLIGDEISKYAALRRAVHRYQLHKHVRFLGYMPQDTLAVMYRLARVFAFPSLYEGFGLPPLEAMASGTPVVASNVSSLPEVAGDAALLVDPHDPSAIAAALREILTDPALDRRLRLKGLERARHFSWEASVRRVRDIYEQVAEPAAVPAGPRAARR